MRGCISFDSYIKPQPTTILMFRICVVYLLIPTSNHNSLRESYKVKSLYIFWFLHQTTTLRHHFRLLHSLYIFWFLHQTTTFLLLALPQLRCISFDSYIKPQRRKMFVNIVICCISFDSYIKPQPITSKYQRTSLL